MELGESSLRSNNDSVDDSTKETSQTDESKAAEQQTSSRIGPSKASKPKVPCVADTGLYFG